MFDSFAISDTGCVRPNNEDRYVLAPELGLYLLADGMGGAKAGERASQLAVDTVVEVVRAAGRRDSQVLLAAVEEANRRTIAAARSDKELQGMGTTIVAALDTGEEISIASVGDSRAYLLEGDGLKPITQDQSWVNEVGRPMGLDEHSLRTHPLRHVLTMAIGTGVPLVVNYYNIKLKAGSQLLLSSDGLHGVVDRSEIEAILRNGGGNGENSLERKCRQLVESARRAGGPDNITCVLLRKQ